MIPPDITGPELHYIRTLHQYLQRQFTNVDQAVGSDVEDRLADHEARIATLESFWEYRFNRFYKITGSGDGAQLLTDYDFTKRLCKYLIVFYLNEDEGEDDTYPLIVCKSTQNPLVHTDSNSPTLSNDTLDPNQDSSNDAGIRIREGVFYCGANGSGTAKTITTCSRGTMSCHLKIIPSLKGLKFGYSVGDGKYIYVLLHLNVSPQFDTDNIEESPFT